MLNKRKSTCILLFYTLIVSHCFSPLIYAQETVEDILAIKTGVLLNDAFLGLELKGKHLPIDSYSEELLAIASSGNASAQSRLGRIYLDGNGIEADYEKAYYWLEKAAEQGHRVAYGNLGYMYDNGLYVEKNPVMAFNFYKKAAQLGENNAFVNLAQCYYEGKGCKRDYIKAAAYFEKSAITDSLRVSETNAGIIYTINLAQYEKGVFWLIKATKQGSPSAAFVLGQCYDNGLGVQKDKEKAQELYRYAYSQGHPYAKSLINE